MKITKTMLKKIISEELNSVGEAYEPREPNVEELTLDEPIDFIEVSYDHSPEFGFEITSISIPGISSYISSNDLDRGFYVYLTKWLESSYSSDEPI